MLYRLGYGKQGLARKNFAAADLLEQYLDANTVSYAVFENLGADGALLDGVTAVQGLDWVKVSDAERPVYDTAMFGGRGGIKSTGTDCTLIYDGTFGVQNDQTIYGAVYFPQYPASGNAAQIIGFGVDGDARLAITNNGSGTSYDVYYGTDQSRNYPRMVDDATDFGVHVFALRYNSNASLDLFWDSVAPVANIDPRDDYTTIAWLRMFSRVSGDCVTGMGYGRIFHKIGADDNTRVSAVMTDLAGLYGVTLV